MGKIKLTKGEMKRQRDALAQFRRYLPTLQLKKQQLQMRLREIRETAAAVEAQTRALEQRIRLWAGLLEEPGVDLTSWVKPAAVTTVEQNVAGVAIPVLQEVVFPGLDFDYYDTPVWVDRAVEQLRELMARRAEYVVLEEQARRLDQELRVTSQRVNLFEKVKIPECLENIRVVRIYLGDQQANAVGIGKVAKNKLAVTAEARA